MTYDMVLCGFACFAAGCAATTAIWANGWIAKGVGIVLALLNAALGVHWLHVLVAK